MNFNPLGVVTYTFADSGIESDMAIVAQCQEYALRRVGWNPGIPMRRYQEVREGRRWLVAEADIRNWRVWRALLRMRYRHHWWRARLAWLSLKERLA